MLQSTLIWRWPSARQMPTPQLLPVWCSIGEQLNNPLPLMHTNSTEVVTLWRAGVTLMNVKML
jgi:hypothetical protein